MKTRIVVGVSLILLVFGILALDGWLRSHGIFPLVSAVVLHAVVAVAYLELFRMIARAVPDIGPKIATTMGGPVESGFDCGVLPTRGSGPLAI